MRFNIKIRGHNKIKWILFRRCSLYYDSWKEKDYELTPFLPWPTIRTKKKNKKNLIASHAPHRKRNTLVFHSFEWTDVVNAPISQFDARPKSRKNERTKERKKEEEGDAIAPFRCRCIDYRFVSRRLGCCWSHHGGQCSNRIMQNAHTHT